MLIDKGHQAGDIVTLKLSSGEEIIAKLVDETDTYVKVSKPMVLASTQQGIGMVPYLITVNPDKDIKINKPISVLELTEDEPAKQYIKITTNIIT
jgi:hypothetical protein